MEKEWLVVSIMILCVAGSAFASDDFGLGEPTRLINQELEQYGMEFAFSMTHVYMNNAKGGTSTHRRAGRYSGLYDLELTTDLEKLLGLQDASFYILAEGSWSKSGGQDATSIGSTFGAGDMGPRRGMDILEAWYEQGFLGGDLRIRAGKIDLTGGFECKGCPVAFDGNLYANDNTSQFLNNALNNNPTIPFPAQGLGFVAYYNPSDLWYAAFGMADAQADSRETGFNTAFHDEDYFVYLVETGLTPEIDLGNGPLQGAYRIGAWLDGQPKAKYSNSTNDHQDVGIYVSADQVVCKENSNPDDTQGIGVFARYGYANSDLNAVTNFWSVGAQYQGLFDGRDDDILGVGFGYGEFSNRDTALLDDNEAVTEVYYNAVVTDWLSISPSLQYLKHPGGAETSDAVVLAVRAQMSF